MITYEAMQGFFKKKPQPRKQPPQQQQGKFLLLTGRPLRRGPFRAVRQLLRGWGIKTGELELTWVDDSSLEIEAPDGDSARDVHRLVQKADNEVKVVTSSTPFAPSTPTSSARTRPCTSTSSARARPLTTAAAAATPAAAAAQPATKVKAQAAAAPPASTSAPRLPPRATSMREERIDAAEREDDEDAEEDLFYMAREDHQEE